MDVQLGYVVSAQCVSSNLFRPHSELIIACEQWDDRLLTLDPLSLAHVLKTPEIYEKPWQSRRIIEALIGRGILAAEGQMHKRHRRVASPAFSIQNMRALAPLVFRKGTQLKDRMAGLVDDGADADGFVALDIAHWVSRATFDVIGVAGFDYNFDAIENEDNELFMAYKEMFEISLSQGKLWRTLLGIWAPVVTRWFVSGVSISFCCMRSDGRVL